MGSGQVLLQGLLTPKVKGARPAEHPAVPEECSVVKGSSGNRTIVTSISEGTHRRKHPVFVVDKPGLLGVIFKGHHEEGPTGFVCESPAEVVSTHSKRPVIGVTDFFRGLPLRRMEEGCVGLKAVPSPKLGLGTL